MTELSPFIPQAVAAQNIDAILVFAWFFIFYVFLRSIR